MTTWLRGVLWVVWFASVIWLWHVESLGPAGALAAGVLGFVLLAWPSASRRRRSALQYVEVGKEPVGSL
jgi:hypothetical protein